MIIGFDAKRAFHNNTGLGNYSRGIIKNLIHFYSENNYVLYTPSHKSLHLHRELKHNTNLKQIQPPLLWPKALSALWRSYAIPMSFKREGIELYHGLSNELPSNLPKNIAKIVSIHDLIFMRHPEWYPKIDVHFYKKKFKAACERADHIIAISEQTKTDIESFFKIKASKISVIYQSCDPLFYDFNNVAYRNEIISKYNLNHPFFFYVGSLNARKNVVSLIKSFGDISDNCGHQLLIAGNGQKTYIELINKQISELGLQDRISIFHGIPNDDLPALYQLADVFVYPSSFEGFGIPIIESLYCRTPVITSEGSCFNETAGEGAIYAKVGDHRDLAEKMLELSQNTNLKLTLAEKGLKHVQKFHREKTSKHLASLYKGML